MWSADAIAKDFIEIVLGWDINEFCLKYEAFALFRLKGIKMNSNDKVVFTRCRVRMLVKRGLQEITGNPQLEMSWKRYETDIVNEYHVILESWPDVTFDPATLGFTALDKVLKALESGECGWAKLTEEQFKHRKEVLARDAPILVDNTNKRKARSDKGKKRGSYKKKLARTVSSDDEDSDSASSA